ncbi:MAG: alanine dehydrogenase [Candidatus Bathyarchaeota archaeon]|nr:alanine dehydrogenase [Candidatus Bathyarchaeota archaeon]MCZ2845703.1 alanine dehydrogenase [Candidatus Bathyarchaeota archaeon]
MSILLIKRDEISSLITMEETIESVEEIMREKEFGRAQMPPKTYLYFNEYNGDLRVMPSYIKKSISAVKIVNVHPNNKNFGLPTVMAIIVLIEPKTGKPIAIMDGTRVTYLRTGAAGGIAIKYLGREGSETIGLIGAGVQAFSQIIAANCVLKINEISVFDIDKGVKNKFIQIMERKYPTIKISSACNIEEAIKNKDILITVTPSRVPIVKNKWIDEGVHINAIGADAPGKQELDPLILKRARIIVDDLQQASHSGEVNVPLKNGILSKNDIYAELGEIISGKKIGRDSNKQITLFDSTGLAIQDAAVAKAIYKKAIKKNLGIKIDLL